MVGGGGGGDEEGDDMGWEGMAAMAAVGGEDEE